MRLLGKTVSISLVAIILMASFMTLRLFNKHEWSEPDKVIAWDVISYYSYLPAAFIENDLTLAFTEREHEGVYWQDDLPDGRHLIKTSMGLSIMYMPFFLVAHATAGWLGYAANGFTVPYAFALVFSGLFYAVLGLCLLRRLLRRHFGEWTTACTLIIVMLCTNLYWYSVCETPMSHAFSFCLFALFAMQTENWHAKPSTGRSISVGLTLGLISLIRPTNILVGIYFLLYGIHSKETLKHKWTLLIESWWKVLLMALAALAVWVPQMIYWYINTDHLLYYSYGNRERFFFNDPKIWKGLFSFRKGWLVYTPVMGFALTGLVPLYRRHRDSFWAIVVFLPIFLYVIFSWWCWWYGGSCGMRALIDIYPLLALPLAAWIAWIGEQKVVWRSVLIVALVATSLLSCFHTLRYANGSIHIDSMTREAYFENFFRSHPTEKSRQLLVTPDYEGAREGIR